MSKNSGNIYQQNLNFIKSISPAGMANRVSRPVLLKNEMKFEKEIAYLSEEEIEQMGSLAFMKKYLSCLPLRMK